MDETPIFAGDEPDVESLRLAYEEAISDLDAYFADCLQAYDDRRNHWQNKSDDFRKNWEGAFPWKGASDQEVNVIGERIDAYIATCMRALDRSHIKAFPTQSMQLPSAQLVSQFLKYLRASYIPRFREEMELSANHLFEKKLAISYVGWMAEDRTIQQKLSLEQIAEINPEVAEMFTDEANEEDLVAMLITQFPKMSKRRATKAVRSLRDTGEAVLSIAVRSKSRPRVETCAPDGDVFFPEYVTDPQRSPFVFHRCFYTEQELRKKVSADGWDEKWVDYVCEHLKGKDTFKVDGDKRSYNDRTTLPVTDDTDLIMVIHGYQRLIDEDDGSEGIYCTVFHPDATSETGEIPNYAKFELLNGFEDYPFVVTRFSNDQKRLYEGKGFVDDLRGPQWQIKVETDSRIDRASMATCPPLMHPAGRPPAVWAPAARVGYRRLGEYAFGPVPPNDPGSSEVMMNMRMQADRAVGLDFDHPTSIARQEFYINKFLSHVREVLRMAWKLYGKMGDDEVFFMVTGSPDPMKMTRDIAQHDFNIVVNFDTLASDPDTAEMRMKQMGSLIQFDRNGRIDIDKFLEFAAVSLDPVAADYFLTTVEESQQKVAADVTDDLAKIFAGIEVPARPNGAAMALQIVQAYAQQEDIAARLQQDEAFAERLSKYGEQYQFQMQQAQNAQIGRIGTAPAQMGGVQTQGMQ